ncbi:MAG: GGDEF domain-containing protein [Rubrobacter sp.]|nr:GGDEF domain-containing protein [Rubrobacter sp.]
MHDLEPQSCSDGTGREPGRPHFVVLQGPSFGDVYHLDGEALVLGSDPFRVDVVVRDATVEPYHAEISPHPESCDYRIRALQGSTRVNDDVLEDGHTLLDGDRVFVGGSVLEFSCGDPVKAHFHGALNRLINHDYLTGLLSKNRFDEEFEHSLEAARSTGRPLSVLMADVDNLKEINDAHGHLIGEFTVGEVGHLMGTLHQTDGRHATRFGGDEYQSVLPGFTKDEAVEIADRIRRMVEEYVFDRDGVETNPTLSLGVATFPEDGGSQKDLTRAADRALYRAKSSGGNTVRR